MKLKIKKENKQMTNIRPIELNPLLYDLAKKENKKENIKIAKTTKTCLMYFIN
jgi:hypothetical protein